LLVDAIRVAGGAGLVLAGLTVAAPIPTFAMVGAGLAAAVPSFVRLVPTGTLRARAGLPAAVLIRGILTFAFFGGDAYVPLTLTSIRGTSATIAGLALTSATMTWTLGSWIQERGHRRWGPRRLVTVGFMLVLTGVTGFATLLSDRVPIMLGPVMWGFAGLGMGLAYSPITLTVLNQATPGREGGAASSLQLTDVLGVALGTGLGGAAVALGHASGWDPRSGLLMAFGMAAAVAATGLVVARRLPRRLA